MHREDSISIAQRYFTDTNIALTGPVTQSTSIDYDVTAFVLTKLDESGRQFPSNVKLKQVRAFLRDIGVRVEIILVNSSASHIEGQVRSNLLYEYGDMIRNSFLSSEGRSASMWIETKRALSDSEKERIYQSAAKILSLHGLILTSLSPTTNENLPSKTAILSILRKGSPVKIDVLCDQIRNAGFEVPSPDWLSRRLDNLRKTGFALRQDDETYVLTAHGISTLGTARTRRSPDISRVLALARRRG